VNIVHLEDEPWDSGIAHYAVTLAVEQSRRGGKRQSPFAGVRRALDRIEFEAHDREAVSVLRQ